MWLYGCWIERVDGASNGKVIKGKPWYWCKAKTRFDGPAGVYTIMTDYYDENDGESPFMLFVNDELVDSWVADQELGSNLPNEQTKVRRSTLEVTLRPGDLIVWKVKPRGHEYGRLDMTWIQKTGEIPPPPPMQMFEAEHMRRRNVWIEHVDAASGNQVVKTGKNRLGYVKMTYEGSAGDFALSTTYFDENDGQSKYWVYINGIKVASTRSRFAVDLHVVAKFDGSTLVVEPEITVGCPSGDGHRAGRHPTVHQHCMRSRRRPQWTPDCCFASKRCGWRARRSTSAADDDQHSLNRPGFMRARGCDP